TIPTNIPPTTIASTPNTPGRPSVHRSALCSAASINPLSSASPIIRGDAACSDYSAALMGAAIDAGQVQIWTDIDGMHNNDPRF
ncbi:hypothetical protein EI534_44655, partial [Pseudomonas frederiksbergensis]|nr:hypothetical protein [Pseudomonas frederiksbergensis]